MVPTRIIGIGILEYTIATLKLMGKKKNLLDLLVFQTRVIHWVLKVMKIYHVEDERENEVMKKV